MIITSLLGLASDAYPLFRVMNSLIFNDIQYYDPGWVRITLVALEDTRYTGQRNANP